MHVIVTGGAGFIGSHLGERLLKEGHEVTAIDSFDSFYSPQTKRRNISAALSSPKFRIIEADVREAESFERDCRGADVIVHLAARPGVQPSLDQPRLYASVNVDGTAAILELARRIGVRRFVFGSSSSVYGNSGTVPFREDDPAATQISPYAVTKRAGELLAYCYQHLYGGSVAALRFFTVYGPRQRPDLAIHKFARRIASGESIEVFGDGSMSRDYTYVDDIVGGIIGAIDWTATTNAFEIFNLGESHATSVTELISLLQEIMGEQATIVRRPEQPGDVRRTLADVRKARQLLGYRPNTSMREGLTLFVDWFRTNAAQLR